jgi:hypothetical protein
MGVPIKLRLFHFGQFTHLVGAIPPWLPQTLGDRSKVKCSLGVPMKLGLFYFVRFPDFGRGKPPMVALVVGRPEGLW